MLTVDNVSSQIGNKILIKNISFVIHPGELAVILGANGAGKSSLMKILSGEKKPSLGTVSLYGKSINIYSARNLALKRALLNQQNAVNIDFQAKEIAMMGRYPHFNNFPTQTDMDIIQEVMAITGTLQLADRTFSTLSGGEQQRVHLARVLAQVWDVRGALLLLDEPVSGMDILYQQQTLSLAAELAKKGFMVIAVLHDLNLAAQYADRVILLKNGRKWYDGPPLEVLTVPNIFHVFEIDADVFTNPQTLKQLIVLKDVMRQLN